MKLLSALSVAAFALSAQSEFNAMKTEELRVQSNPMYSAAVNAHKSPEDALAQIESALEESRFSESANFIRFLNLPTAAKAALEAGQNDKAKSYAEEALDFLKRHPKLPPSPTANAVFYCNLVLGRLALLKSDIAAAENYLLLSGKTQGTPSLQTFGPNMSLARELLKLSHRETVLKCTSKSAGSFGIRKKNLVGWISGQPMYKPVECLCLAQIFLLVALLGSPHSLWKRGTGASAQARTVEMVKSSPRSTRIV